MVGSKEEHGFEIEQNITEEVLYCLGNIGHLYHLFVSKEHFDAIDDFVPITVDVGESYEGHYTNMMRNYDDPIFTTSTMPTYVSNHFNNSTLGLCNYMVLSGWLHSYLCEQYAGSGFNPHKMH